MEINLIKSSDVATILGISKALAYRLLAEGTIPSVRFGRTVRCRPKDLETFILVHTKNKQEIVNGNNVGSHEKDCFDSS